MTNNYSERGSRDLIFCVIYPRNHRIIFALSLRDDNVKSDWTLSIATVRLGKRKGGIVAANASTNAGEGFARRIVARTAAETVCLAELDEWRVHEGRCQLRLVVIRCFTWNWESHAGVALEDDSSRTVFEWLLTAAGTEEEWQAAGLVLS